MTIHLNKNNTWSMTPFAREPRLAECVESSSW